MVKASTVCFRDARIAKKLTEILVCPLSKQPLRVCVESNSLISDALGVSYPIVGGIPCLVPKDGKLLDDDVSSEGGNGIHTSNPSTRSCRGDSKQIQWRPTSCFLVIQLSLCFVGMFQVEKAQPSIKS